MKNYENPSIFVKVTAKKQWHLFSGHGVYFVVTSAKEVVFFVSLSVY